MAVDSEVLKNVNVYLFLDNFKEFWLTREFFYFYKGKKKLLKDLITPTTENGNFVF